MFYVVNRGPWVCLGVPVELLAESLERRAPKTVAAPGDIKAVEERRALRKNCLQRAKQNSHGEFTVSIFLARLRTKFNGQTEI